MTIEITYSVEGIEIKACILYTKCIRAFIFLFRLNFNNHERTCSSNPNVERNPGANKFSSFTKSTRSLQI